MPVFIAVPQIIHRLMHRVLFCIFRSKIQARGLLPGELAQAPAQLSGAYETCQSGKPSRQAQTPQQCASRKPPLSASAST